MIRYGALSLAWIRQQGWDYSKYKDRRGTREAYQTLMKYEISDLLQWAYEAGVERGIREAAEAALSVACGLGQERQKGMKAAHQAILELAGEDTEQKEVDPPPVDQL